MDIYDSQKRSEIMSKIKSSNTIPELMVRKLIHKMGYRFRLKVKYLPGNPDIVLPRHKKVIFVHGCFWHQHTDCVRAKIPKTRRLWWENKLFRNKARDEEISASIISKGWKVLIIWECEIKKLSEVTEKIKNFLKDK